MSGAPRFDVKPGPRFVVASGRSAYEATLIDPDKMPTSIGAWCEPLLSVTIAAWKRDHQTRWDRRASVSFETGSNLAQW